MADAGGWANNFGSTGSWNAVANNLGSGMQSAATYDPTQPVANSDGPQTNAARMLGTTGMQTQQQAQQQPAGGSLANNWMTFAQTAQPAATAGSATGPAVATSRMGIAANANQNIGNTLTPTLGGQNTYTGPSLVSLRDQDGRTQYYKFDPKTGAYTYYGIDASAYNPLGIDFSNIVGAIPGPVTQMGVSAAEAAGAVATSLGGGRQIAGGLEAETTGVAAVNQAYASARDSYLKPFTEAQAAAAAGNAATKSATDRQSILDYMIANNGVAPSQYAPGVNAGTPRYSQADLAAAAQQYTSSNSAQFNNGAQLVAPDTGAVDTNGLSALLAMNSQYQTGAGGADAAAIGATGGFNSVAQGGQNSIAHDKDYAAKFNTNLAVFNDAVSKQGQADQNASGQKLYNDIQSVSDMLAMLQQHAGQLSTESQQAVQAQIQALQKQISDYQASAQQLGANNAHVAGIASGILSAGGQLAAAAV